MEMLNDNIGAGAASSQTGAVFANSDAGIETLELVQKLPHLSFLAYCKLMEPLGQELQERYGIFKLVPVVQSAHESTFGNSGLARRHGNLFGIVATDGWKTAGGMVAEMPTFEFVHGVRSEMKREFRAYRNWKDSFEDWAKLITGLPIYAKACELMKNKDTVKEGIMLMARYYATDPQYGGKLISLLDLVS